MAGGDYTGHASTPLTFGPGVQTQPVAVVTLGDTLVENQEHFTVDLSGSSANAVITDNQGDGYIDDDGDTYGISIDNQTVIEGGTATFTVSLDQDVIAGTVTVDYVTNDGLAVAGSDYTGHASTQLIFSPGVQTQPVAVVTLGDTLVENQETFTVDLSGASLNAAITDNQGDGYIDDDGDTYTVSISNVATSPVLEANTNVAFTISLANVDPLNGVSGTVSVDYATVWVSATPGVDYTLTSGTQIFAAGTAGSELVSVPILDDSYVEGDETFDFTLSLPSGCSLGAPSSETVTIQDDGDTATLTFSWPAFQPEDSGGYVFTVTLDNPVQGGFHVAYTTDDGGATVLDADYTDNDGTLIFAGNAGESQTITVAMTPDTKVEADETFTVLLGALSNLDPGINPANIGIPGGPVTGTIQNDDQYGISIDDITVAEDGGSAVFTVSLTFSVPGDLDASVDYATIDGSALAGSDYTNTTGTLTIPAGSTTGTISVPIIDDTLNDDGEVFFINLSDPTPAASIVNITDNIGQCTITDNDCDLTMAVTLTGTATGTVFPDVAGNPHTILCGTDAPLIATPGPGSVFVKWTGDVAEPLLAETTILMSGDKTVTAEFADSLFALSLAQSGQGTVSSSPGGGPGLYEDMVEGTVVTLTAVESVAGWTFSHWTGGVANSTALNTTVTMDSDRYITAFFTTPGLDPDVDNDGDGYTINQGDCDDTNASIYPGAPEICGDGLDQDCNGLDTACSVDNDGDGYTVADNPPDCDDNNASINPGATEICGNDVDEDCDGSDLACTGDDLDGDDDGYSINMGDCNDDNDAIYPGAKEICGNGVDEDCYDGDRPCGAEEKCVSISDNPLETQIQAAPANIMFVMDDSGSMDSEIMSSGAWPSGWEEKWTGMNAMYYDPNLTYTPWPNHLGAGNLPDADRDNPLTYPVATSQHIASNPFDINSNPYLNAPSGTEYITVQRGGGTTSGSYICADAVQITGVPATATAGIDVIVDNNDLTFTGSSGSTTNWQGGWYNGSYFRIYGWVAGASATWILPVPVAGSYTVSVYLQDKTYFVNDADYQILSSAAPPVDRSINQQTVADGWTQLPGSYTFAESTPTQATVSFTSYFVWNDDNTDGVRDDDEIYLVDISGSGTTGTISYYRVNDTSVIANGSSITSFTQLTNVTASPPAGIVTGRTYAEERQNFVNWYQYARTRDMMAKAAVSRVIEDMQNVNIGIHSIQNRVNETVLPVKVPSEPDGTETLLTALYDDIYPSGMTPLRGAFIKVGKYFEEGVTIGGLPGEPFATAAEGGACQQNFVILMTDGGYNGTAPTLGNEDGDNNTIYDGGCFADAWEKTLGDIAMYYYERDLSPTLDNLVPITSMDSARHQHLVSYMISFGVFGTIDPANWPDCPSDCPPWPDPYVNDQQKIDDMFHAAVNGRGKFLSTGSPQALVDALNAIMNDILNRIGSGSAVSINSQELHSDTVIFQGIYDTTNWTGDIQAFDLDDYGNIEPDYKWSAKEQIAAQDWNTGREIITFGGSVTGGTPFRAADIPAAQLALLNADVPTATAIVNYLRGDVTNEQDQGGTYSFRSRSGKLGDIVHSTPLLLNGVLYVGANDGMLHAFDEITGDEIFAYVPRIVYQNLARLTTPNPGYNHTFYVDQAPFAARVGASDLLVGTLGKGGKGVYCLDVTNTGNAELAHAELNAANIVKWEYPDSTDPDNSPDPNMGYGFSRAFIVDSNIGSKVVILGNGYQSTNSRAVLYVLDAATGTLLRKIDTGVGSPPVPDGGTGDCNGLSTPVLIDIDMDKKVDYAYAGDLLGNMWKFDLTANNVASWEIAYSDGVSGKPLFQAKNELGFSQPITMKPDVMRQCGAGSEGYMVLFGTGRYLGDEDFHDTSVQTVYGIWDWADAWVTAGDSGPDKYLGSFTAGSPRMLSNLQGNVSLSTNAQAVTLLDQTQVFFGDVNGENYRVLSDNPISLYSPSSDPADSHAGWYFDLPATSEKAIMNGFVRDYLFNIITTIPSDSPCGAGGNSIIMSMDSCDGSRLSAPFFDINGDGIIDMQDMINIGSVNNPIWVAPTGWSKTGIYYPPAALSLPGGVTKQYFSTSEGNVDTAITEDEKKGLFSWREIE